MTESEFNRLAADGYNRIPLILETLADLDTPLSVYLKLANRPYTYLLESVVGGERFGRYSFIGLAADSRIEVRGHDCTEFENGRIKKSTNEDDPLEFVRAYLMRFKAAVQPELPRFCGGLVGYFGYEAVRYIEKKLAVAAKAASSSVPDVLLLLSEQLAVVDNVTGKIYLVIYVDPSSVNAFRQGNERLQELLTALRQPLETPLFQNSPSQPAQSEFGEAAYIGAVDRAKRYIADGDVMQVVLSQRMSRPFEAAPLALYRALRALNPSPYMFFFNFGDFQLVGASPEILVRLEKSTVTLRPIAGTRPRGKTPEEDAILARELLADPKERAEHLMLIDLGRNDVGRVAQTGSVKVTDNMLIEYYSHVMHIVSSVEGTLKAGLDAIAVMKATFPAGTVSGAPKVRAMEIIDELEPTPRGIYAGAVGYLGFNGDMDLAIAIRTGLIQDGKLYVQAGGGIVADSISTSEWQETQNKARAILRAAEIATAGFNGDKR